MVDTVHSTELDRDTLDRKYCRPELPVLAKEEVSDWRATRKWDPDYLDSLLGHRTAILHFREDGITGANFDTEVETLPFSEARRHVDEDGRYYVSQMSIERSWLSKLFTGSDVHFPQLADDIRRPRFLVDRSKFHHVTMLWFGGDRCKSALHWDTLNNFFFQIHGEKRFMLFAPAEAENLYPEYGTEYDHCARVNVFDPDETEFPRYENAESVELKLEPGDMLYIPKGWWHAADSLTTSISVNFWWETPNAYARYLIEVLADRFDRQSPDLLELPDELRL